MKLFIPFLLALICPLAPRASAAGGSAVILVLRQVQKEAESSRLDAEARHVASKLRSDGSTLSLIHPLSTGEHALALSTFGRELVASVLDPASSALTSEDRAIVIETLLYNFDLLDYPRQLPVALLLNTLSPVREQIQFADLADSKVRGEALRNLYLALRLVRTHRDLVASEDAQRARELFAQKAFSVVRDNRRDRAAGESAMSDDAIVEAFRRMQDQMQTDLVPEWSEFTNVLQKEFSSSLEDAIANDVGREESKLIVRNILATSAITWTPWVAYGLWTGEASLAGGLASIVVPALTPLASMLWHKFQREDRTDAVRARYDRFADRCQRDLLNLPSST